MKVPLTNGSEVVYIGSSPYGTYRVVDMMYHGRAARMVFGEGASPQSGMARDDNRELLFDYNQRFLEIMMSQLPHRALVIGGGVLMLPRAAHTLFADLTIDVVEIDKLLIDIAREYFDLPNSPRLRTHIADGLEFVQTAREPYDMIVIDAFAGYTVPPHLIDARAARQYRDAMTDDGIVAINFISEYKRGRPSLAHDLVDNFSRSFTHLQLYQSDPEDDRGREQNMLLVASNATLSLDFLQSEAVTPA